jgi:hypothetical protein
MTTMLEVYEVLCTLMQNYMAIARLRGDAQR